MYNEITEFGCFCIVGRFFSLLIIFFFYDSMIFYLYRQGCRRYAQTESGRRYVWRSSGYSGFRIHRQKGQWTENAKRHAKRRIGQGYGSRQDEGNQHNQSLYTY